MAKKRKRRRSAKPYSTLESDKTKKRLGEQAVGSLIAIVSILLIALVIYIALPENNTPTTNTSPSIVEVVQDDLSRASTIFTTIINTYTHDSDAFTQGLEFHNGVLYESTGLFGESTVRQVDHMSGVVEKSAGLDRKYFGEGITIFNNTLYMLTWRNREGFTFNPESLEQIGNFAIVSDNGEGWGLSHDGEHLIMSDGSSTLYFLDPNTLEEVKRIGVYEKVRSNGKSNWFSQNIVKLNELEFIDGFIFANVWFDNRLAIVDPQSGEVRAWLDLNDISEGERADTSRTLNGIAFDEESRKFMVTGKLWSHIYEVALPDFSQI